MNHHNMGPSAASRWMECTASVKATEGMEQEPSRAAAEGTVAHTVTELLRLGRIADARDMEGQVIEQDGFQITVDEEMVIHANAFAEFCVKLPGEAHVEEQVSLNPWIPGGFGTADHVAIGDGVIHVVDFKYGKGVKVDARGNVQMRLYALGAVHSLGWLYGIDGPKGHKWTVKTTIYQPRIGHIDTEELPLEELLEWGRTVVRPAAIEAQSDEGRFKAGKHCRFCLLSGSCAEQARHYRQEVLGDFEDLTAATLSDEQLGELLDEMDMLKKWMTSIEQEAKARAQQGRPPVGSDGPYKLVEGRKRREWTFESDAEFVLKHHLGEQAYEKTLLSPAKAEKALGKGVDISDLIRQLPGAPTLVPASDKREPIPSADGDFDNLEQS